MQESSTGKNSKGLTVPDYLIAGAGLGSLFFGLLSLLPISYDLTAKEVVVYPLVAFGALVYFGLREHLKGLHNAVASREASQGAHQEGRVSARASGSQAQGRARARAQDKGRHYHRPTVGRNDNGPIPAQSCAWAKIGEGQRCLVRDQRFSHGDDWLRI